ncbi:hypothetical protein JZ785_23650 [Alicyclobacillus curvatus]|nr:hypothetical protein JZ785_23650 [Alicyclobacillus curvatus]
MRRLIHGISVEGVDVDEQTRCRHYHTERDIIAVKFPCCQTYYPCRECHDEVANHKASTWQRSEFLTHAVLCGVCGDELTVDEYLQCSSRCPSCNAEFNPRCSLHYSLYFAVNTDE